MKLIEIILILSPILLEIAFDIWRWSQNKSDKPVSTIFRGVYFVLLAVLFHVLGYNTWWQTLILLIFTHLFFFDFILNIIRNKPFFYHSNSGFDQIYARIPPIAEILLKSVFLYSAYFVYADLDRIL